MTFELLEAIIVKNKIPKNVCLVNDSENDLCTTDMNGIQYSANRNEICFMDGEYQVNRKPDYEQEENMDWKILWCDAKAVIDENRMQDISSCLLNHLLCLVPKIIEEIKQTIVENKDVYMKRKILEEEKKKYEAYLKRLQQEKMRGYRNQ